MRLSQLAGTCVSLSALLAAFAPGTAAAGTGNGVNAGHDDDRYFATASQQPVITGGQSDGGPVCDWKWLTVGEILAFGPPQGGPPPTPEVLASNMVLPVNGVDMRVYLVRCPSGDDIRLVNPNVTVPDLIPGVYDYADDTIELPVTLVNPPVNTKGIVNLGMWLAVEEAAYEPITAEAGPAWITVTPTIGQTRFAFGNGDDEVCEGFGVPIVDLETLEEGPCGYTYAAPGDFTLTITSTWELPYTSSSGSGSLSPLRRTSTYTYDVIEIQTVGASG